MRGIADQRLAEAAIGGAAIAHDKLRHVEYRQSSFADQGGGASPGGFRSEIVAVGFGLGQGDINVTWAHAAKIVSTAGRADIGRTNGKVVVQQGAKRNAADMW